MHETEVLIAMCCGDTAKSLLEIVEITSLPLQEVIETVDRLVARNILRSDNSFHLSEIGTIVYMISPAQEAQDAYEALQRPCAWNQTCPNDAEYLFLAEERKVYHALFCQEHRKRVRL